MRHSIRKSSSLLLTGLPLLLACGDSTAPPPNIVGTYTPVAFTTTPSGGSERNEIQAGSTLTLILASDGSTSGHLHIAANGTNPVLDADMAGTFTQNGDVVTFTQAADTFVRNMVFRIETLGCCVVFLNGDQAVSGTRVSLSLSRA
jgi:hypothetical protein